MAAALMQVLMLVLLPSCIARSPSPSPSSLPTLTTQAPPPTFTKSPSPTFSLPTAPTPTLTVAPSPTFLLPSAPTQLPSSPPSSGVTTSTSEDSFPPLGSPVASLPGSGASFPLTGLFASLIASFAAGALMFV